MSNELRGFTASVVEVALQLRHDNMKAVNTRDAPDTLTPTELAGVRVGDGHVSATLQPDHGT